MLFKTGEKLYLTNFEGDLAECITGKKTIIRNEFDSGSETTDVYESTISRLLFAPIIKAQKVVAVIGIGNKPTIYSEDALELIEYIVDISWSIVQNKIAFDSYLKEQQMLNDLINTIPDKIYFKDKNSRFIRINNAMATDLRLNDHADVIGKSDADFYGEVHAKKAIEDEQLIIKTGKALLNYQEKEFRKDGSVTWVATTKVPLRDNQGEIIGVMGISHDITDRIRMEEELIKAKQKAEESDRLKSAFLANMSHEIRTPLNGILGFVHMILKKEKLSKKDTERYASLIRDSSDHLIQIIDDIIDISSIESGNIEIDLGPMHINAFLNELYTLYSESLKNDVHAINLKVKNVKEDLIIYTDENHLRQIFINLLDNAIKFTEEGLIEFGIESTNEDKITFFIRDTGIGIAEDKYEAIFDRFRQIELDLQREYGGNGLGLSIAKKLVQLMRGEIWVESEFNKGSTFRFNLPLIIADSDSDLISFDTNQIASELQPSVMIVDDDEVGRILLKELLTDKYNKIVVAKTGKEALTMYSSAKPDIILMDIRLPDTSGLDVVKEIRKFDNKTYIIAQSAHAVMFDRNSALEAGCNDFIKKPIDPDLLMEKLTKRAS